MYQYYVIIVTKDHADNYTHEVKWAFDPDADQARLNAEALYYTELAAAAVSARATHAVTLLSSEGVPLLNHCYRHAEQPAPETVTEE